MSDLQPQQKQQQEKQQQEEENLNRCGQDCKCRSCAVPGGGIRHMPLFEASWEVANKIGGIYTVMETKSKVMSQLHDHHYFIGPYKRFYDYSQEVLFDSPRDQTNFGQSNDLPEWLQASIVALGTKNIRIYSGTWLIESRPKVLLVDYCALIGELDAIKYFYCEASHCAPLPQHDITINDCLMFGSAAGRLLDEIAGRLKKYTASNDKKRCIVQCHEWSSGPVLTFARKQAENSDYIATIFTTHATTLGRFLSSDNVDIYSDLFKIDADYEATKRNIYHQHCIERAAIHLAHVFTTVSGVTARECSTLHQRDADFITPNGINYNSQVFHDDKRLVTRPNGTIEDHQSRENARSMLLSFTKSYFIDDETIDLDQVKFAMLSGRYEYRNKGIDIFIESLARLNYTLQQQQQNAKKKRTLVVFIIVPAPHNGFNKEFLETMALSRHKQIVTSILTKKVQARINVLQAANNNNVSSPNYARIMTEDEERELENLAKLCANFRKCGSITTHNIVDDANDPILRDLNRCKLLNGRQDRVKVVFHPEFVKENNIVFSMDYKKLIKGCDIGVFPSFYEPWGYTPMEFMQEGKLSITSDLSGFGEYVEKLTGGEQTGVGVLNRRDTPIEQSVNLLAQMLDSFMSVGEDDMRQARKSIEKLTKSLDWTLLIDYYEQAMRASLYRLDSREFAQFALDSLPLYRADRSNFLSQRHLELFKANRITLRANHITERGNEKVLSKEDETSRKIKGRNQGEKTDSRSKMPANINRVRMGRNRRSNGYIV
ncbi:MAG: Glycogen [starch] synthase, liver [Marteilia pararefringens]